MLVICPQLDSITQIVEKQADKKHFYSVFTFPGPRLVNTRRVISLQRYLISIHGQTEDCDDQMYVWLRTASPNPLSNKGKYPVQVPGLIHIHPTQNQLRKPTT